MPTHIADVDMSFITEYHFDADIWNVIGEWGGSQGSRSPLFVLLFEYKVLCGDPIARLPVDLQSTGCSSTHAQQNSTQPLNCNHFTFQLRRKRRKRETCSEARSPVHMLSFIELNINREIKSSRLEI